MRNHEGYYDPTAGWAIRNVMEQREKKDGKMLHLSYILGELPCFERIYKTLKDWYHDK